MATTTHDAVFTAAHQKLLSNEGVKTAHSFEFQLQALSIVDLEKIDAMCTNNSLNSMVSWILSQRAQWALQWSDCDQRWYVIQAEPQLFPHENVLPRQRCRMF